MAKNVIEVRGMIKDFGELRAVDGVDLGVWSGELFGLIGHNGAGKSTLFKMILGLIPPTAGEIVINGQSLRGGNVRKLKRHIGYLPENLAFYDNLSGLETLCFFADLKGVDRACCAALLAKVGLTDAASRRVRGYSKGMRQRLGLAQALLGTPELLFLDEPTSGLDPEAIREFYQIIHELKKHGVTIILSSHILAEIQERVDRLAIMKNGRIQALGTVQALRQQMNLPLQFSITLTNASAYASVSRAVQQFAVSGQHPAGKQLTLDCRRDDKMPLLHALMALGDEITDINILEPSLEDVFLRYAE